MTKQPSTKPLRDLPEKDPWHFVQLTEVESVPINWLWKPYIPRAALTLLMGDGGYGKSWLTCSLAADLSKGRGLPGQEPLPPQKILMIGAEDGLSQVIKPKMEMLDAAMENIRASDKGFTLDASSMVHLVRHIREYDAAIVFLDPLVVYMGGRIDMFRANEARSMLTLLGTVAQDTNTAIVAVHHVRKSSEGATQHKVMGSADFVNGVRSTLLVDVSKGGQRYMAHVKSNWARNGATLAYNFGDQGFEWQGEYDNTPVQAPEVSRTPRGAVQEWLREALRNGPVPAVEMQKQATAKGFTERTLARAKIGVIVSKNVGGMWVWALDPAEVARLQKAEEVISGPLAAASEIEALGRGPFPSTTPMLPPSDDLAYARSILAKGQGSR